MNERNKLERELSSITVGELPERIKELSVEQLNNIKLCLLSGLSFDEAYELKDFAYCVLKSILYLLDIKRIINK